jgi:general secretion pathway protein I
VTRILRSQDGRGPTDGFTLLEVAIALAIVGVGVTTVLNLFSGGLRMEANASVRTRAVVHARALLDATVAIVDLQPGSERGEYDDGMRWERAVREATEYQPEQHDLQVKGEVTMYEIEVSVLWPQAADREGVYTVRTLRVGQRPTP